MPRAYASTAPNRCERSHGTWAKSRWWAASRSARYSRTSSCGTLEVLAERARRSAGAAPPCRPGASGRPMSVEPTTSPASTPTACPICWPNMAPPMDRIMPISGPAMACISSGSTSPMASADPLGHRVDQLLPGGQRGLDPLGAAPRHRRARNPRAATSRRRARGRRAADGLVDGGPLGGSDARVLAAVGGALRRPSGGRSAWPCPSSPGRPRSSASGRAAGRPHPGRSGSSSRTSPRTGCPRPRRAPKPNGFAGPPEPCPPPVGSFFLPSSPSSGSSGGRPNPNGVSLTGFLGS